jgi:amino acid permease
MDPMWKAVALVIGTCIGAGVLALPKAFTLSGFLPAMLLTIVIGAVSIMMNLFVTEVTLRTKKEKQIVALAEMYLGKWGKYIILVCVTAGMFGALVAYTVAIGEIGEVFTGVPNTVFFALITFVAFAVLSKGLKAVGEIEVVLTTVMIVFLLAITVFMSQDLDVSNLAQMNIDKIFLPYGAIFFALLSYSVLPEVEEILKNEKHNMFKASIYGMLICIVIYITFPLVFVSEFGTGVAEVATESLSGWLGVVGNFVAVLTMGTSYLAVGMVLRDIFGRDLKMGYAKATVLVCAVPFLVSFLISPSFLTVVGLTGAYTGSVTGIMLCLMVQRARKYGNDKPASVVPAGNWLIYLLIGFFALGIVLQTLAML